MEPAHQYTITTPRLFLRNARPDDDQDIYYIRTNAETMVYTSQYVDTDVSDSREWMRKRFGPNSIRFVIELRPTEEEASSDSKKRPTVIGSCGSTELPSIGYLIGRDWWGKGYATEATQAFIAFYWSTFPQGYPGLKPEDQNHLLAIIHKDNLGSIKMATKCGFQLCGEIEVADWKTGEPIKLNSYRIERPESTVKESG